MTINSNRSKANRSELNIEDFGYQQELKRVLTFKDLLFYGLVFMVPVAPMGVYGYVADISKGMAPFTYIVGVVAMIFTALSYAYMSRAVPIAGSVYSYASWAISPHVGFLAGWVLILDYVLIPSLVYLVAGLALHEMLPILPYWGWIMVFVLVNTWINIRNIKLTARSNLVILILQFIALAIFFIVAIRAIIHGVGAGAFTLKPFWNPSSFSISMVLAATALSVTNFLGFDAITTLAEETTDAKRTVGKATVISLFLVGGLFMSQTYVASLIQPDYQAFDNLDTAFYTVAQIAGGDVLRVICALSIAIAWGFGCGLASQAAISRLLYSMSRDHMIPGFFGKVHPKYHTPYISTIITGILSIGFGMLVRMDILTTVVNFGALLGFLFLHVSVVMEFVIKQKKRDLKSLIKYLISPSLGFVIIFFVWINLQTEAKIVGFSWLALGFMYLAIKTKGFKVKPPAFSGIE